MPSHSTLLAFGAVAFLAYYYHVHSKEKPITDLSNTQQNPGDKPTTNNQVKHFTTLPIMSHTTYATM